MGTSLTLQDLIDVIRAVERPRLTQRGTAVLQPSDYVPRGTIYRANFPELLETNNKIAIIMNSTDVEELRAELCKGPLGGPDDPDQFIADEIEELFVVRERRNPPNRLAGLADLDRLS